jgi:hypothetical protein
LLLGSVLAKAACRMLMKLTPGVDFTNMFRYAQLLQGQIPTDPNKNTVKALVFLHLCDLHA